MLQIVLSLGSAVIGGGAALLGVFFTIKYYKNQEKTNFESEQLRNISGFYYMLTAKINMIAALSQISENPTVIPATPIYTSEENMFLYNRIQSVLSKTNDDTIRELVAFMSDLEQLESARNECILQQHIRGTFRPKDKSDYKEILLHCNNKLNADTSRDLQGIINILEGLREVVCNL